MRKNIAGRPPVQCEMWAVWCHDHQLPFFMADYVLDYRESDPMNHALDRCELCGGLRIEQETDRPEREALDMLRRLAFLHDENPRALRLLLIKIAHPESSQRDMARELGCSRNTVQRAMTRLKQDHPRLAAVWGLNHNHVRAARERWKAQTRLLGA